MSREAKLPGDFHEWGEGAQAHWIQQGPLTQREMLRWAADELGLDVDIDGDGSLTNRDLGRFVAAVVGEGGDR
jgi:hypothetical protein